MKKMTVALLIALLAMSVSAARPSKKAVEPAGGPKDYKGKKGKIIHFPLGDLSFADELVSFQIGEPGPVDERAIRTRRSAHPIESTPAIGTKSRSAGAAS